MVPDYRETKDELTLLHPKKCTKITVASAPEEDCLNQTDIDSEKEEHFSSSSLNSNPETYYDYYHDTMETSTHVFGSYTSLTEKLQNEQTFDQPDAISLYHHVKLELSGGSLRYPMFSLYESHPNRHITIIIDVQSSFAPTHPMYLPLLLRFSWLYLTLLILWKDLQREHLLRYYSHLTNLSMSLTILYQLLSCSLTLLASVSPYFQFCCERRRVALLDQIFGGTFTTLSKNNTEINGDPKRIISNHHTQAVIYPEENSKNEFNFKLEERSYGMSIFAGENEASYGTSVLIGRDHCDLEEEMRDDGDNNNDENRSKEKLRDKNKNGNKDDTCCEEEVHGNYYSNGTEVSRPGTLVYITWLLYATALPAELTVLIGYWTFDYHSGTDPLSFANFYHHGMIAFLLLLDGNIVGRIPLRLKHSLLFFFFSFAYITWTLIYAYLQIDGGVIYNVLDWRQQPKIALLVSSSMIFVIGPLNFIFCLFFAIWSQWGLFYGDRRLLMHDHRDSHIRL